MPLWLTNILSKFGGYLLAILAIVGVLFGVRQSGKEAGKAEIQIDSAKDTIERIAEAKEVEREVQSLSDDDIDAGLSDWVRDNPDSD